jgi:hypothetical protein
LGGNICALRRGAVSIRQLTGSLPRIPEHMETVYRNEPGASYTATFEFSFKVALLDLITVYRRWRHLKVLVCGLVVAVAWLPPDRLRDLIEA